MKDRGLDAFCALLKMGCATRSGRLEFLSASLGGREMASDKFRVLLDGSREP